MSTEIIFQARAIKVTEGARTLIELQVKCFSSNVSPKPRSRERKHMDFSQFGRRLDPAAPLDIQMALESMAREYCGGCYSENYRHLDGVEAYNLWAKRIRRAAPEVHIPAPRLSKTCYGFRRYFDGRKAVAGLFAGTELDATTAENLVRNGIYPKVKTNSPYDAGKTLYLAFVKDDQCYYAPTKGARRGWGRESATLCSDVREVKAAEKIEINDAGTHTVRCTEANGVVLFFEAGHDLRSAHMLSRANYYSPFYMDQAQAEMLSERLRASCPESRWDVIPRSVLEEAIVLATITNTESNPQPAR